MGHFAMLSTPNFITDVIFAFVDDIEEEEEEAYHHAKEEKKEEEEEQRVYQMKFNGRKWTVVKRVKSDSSPTHIRVLVERINASEEAMLEFEDILSC